MNINQLQRKRKALELDLERSVMQRVQALVAAKRVSVATANTEQVATSSSLLVAQAKEEQHQHALVGQLQNGTNTKDQQLLYALGNNLLAGFLAALPAAKDMDHYAHFVKQFEVALAKAAAQEQAKQSQADEADAIKAFAAAKAAESLAKERAEAKAQAEAVEAAEALKALEAKAAHSEAAAQDQEQAKQPEVQDLGALATSLLAQDTSLGAQALASTAELGEQELQQELKKVMGVDETRVESQSRSPSPSP